MSWWRRGVVYEAYLRSFLDTDGDGVGDLRGVTAQLPYLRWLGVDAVWLPPISPSPQRDFGYDITDHTAIDPQLGSLEDFDALVAAAHGHGLRVLLDYVPNHTSHRHPWFRKRPDWYLWHDGPPPNNWLSVFGGSAWEQVGERSYYHAYLREQPDLNWRNPEVRRAMYAVLDFWIARGVDGFRVDAVRQLLKDPELLDNPPNPAYRSGEMPEYDSLLPLHTADRDEIQDIVAEMRAVIGDEQLMIAEVYAPIEWLVRYYGEDGRGGPAVQLPPDLDAVAGRGHRRAGRSLRGGAPQGRVAELGARQSRPLARGLPRGRSAGAGGGHAPAHPARDADALLRRRDRDGRRARPARARGRAGGRDLARPGAHAVAVGRDRRLHRRRAVTAIRRSGRQRRRPARRPALGGDVVLSTQVDGGAGGATLRADEGLVLRI